MTDNVAFAQDNNAFDPNALQAMADALGEVCRRLKIDNDQDAREVMAIRVIELARCGERDPERLAERVLREACAAPTVVDTAPAD
jgi:hypothetical protein